MGEIYNSDSIALSSGGGGGGGDSSVTVDGIKQDGNGNIQLDADSYRGSWVSGAIYRLNNIVSETVNGVPGLYVCLVESSTAEPSGSGNWRRIAGSASNIDGLSPVDGKLAYNGSTQIDAGILEVTPEFNGELSQTVNLTTGTVINLSSFVNTLYNTNPAAVLRVVISASESMTVAFTEGGNYWLPDGTYSDTPPEFNVNAMQPLTIIEVTNILNTGAPGVKLQQVYPVVSDGSDDPALNNIPAVGKPGSLSFMLYTGTTVDPGTAVTGGSLKYSGVNDGDYPVSQYQNLVMTGTWELRGYASTSVNSTKKASNFLRIDGTNLMPQQQLLQAVNIKERVKNCRYSLPDNSMIDCDVLVGGRWYPFSASASDSTRYGPLIFAKAAEGFFGDVAEYQEQ